MALRVTVTTFALVTWLTIQLATGPSKASAMDTFDDAVNVINDGIDWVAEKVARYAMEGKLIKLDGEDNSVRNSRQLPQEEEDEAPAEEKLLVDDPEGRLFIGTGFNGTGVSLNLQGLQTAIGTAIGVAVIVGIIVIIILIIIALATGRDVYSVSKGLTNRFTDPYEEEWYAPNYNYHNYRDQSTYTSYRALDEAARKYGDDKE
ncbi:uncharacterized protein LOC135199867 [Macrobrachium nipponense]|uniref:uncharacterized protein LOC135199867 n=1 Tax=Macrobrachium nipponense TaxID=159736 RepID=UPI0030C7C80A